LIEKRRAETISAKELRELKKLTDRIEKLDAERLELLTELAALRNVPLRKLIKQLGLKPVPHD
jgi:predicted transcriptional regulator